jgi:hypothetical protein
MHGATVADPNPIAKTTPMKITQTFRPGYPVANLIVMPVCIQVAYLELFKADYTFSPNQWTSLLQSIYLRY